MSIFDILLGRRKDDNEPNSTSCEGDCISRLEALQEIQNKNECRLIEMSNIQSQHVDAVACQATDMSSKLDDILSEIKGLSTQLSDRQSAEITEGDADADVDSTLQIVDLAELVAVLQIKY